MEKLKVFVIVFATCSMSALVGFGLGYFVFGDISAPLEAHAEARVGEPIFYEDTEDAAPESEHLFVITSRDGAIVVYSAGEEHEIHDAAVNALPEVDRERLEQGIFADSEEELVRILEDYGS
ncbi:MAG: hypothetical protein FWF77_02015 [Defluviitaleaceae bacterium]|nr:hypothetical protein [Defluviitaleaceae bacterium]